MVYKVNLWAGITSGRMTNIMRFFSFALVLAGGALFSAPALADFQGAAVPTSVDVLYCDSNPRILVQFADSTQNIWYPANLGDQSKAFLTMAITAKTSGQNLYYYGSGAGTTTSSYCLAISARQVYI